jgi:hypothetical protein
MRAIERLLRRHVVAPSPEAHLVVAVLCQAIADAASLNRDTRRCAHRFLRGDDLDTLACLVGLHPDFVREVARRAGYWATPPVQPPAPFLPPKNRYPYDRF